MCNYSVVEWHEEVQSFVLVDYARELTAKPSSKYGEYGSFEHSSFCPRIFSRNGRLVCSSNYSKVVSDVAQE